MWQFREEVQQVCAMVESCVDAGWDQGMKEVGHKARVVLEALPSDANRLPCAPGRYHSSHKSNDHNLLILPSLAGLG